MYIRKGYPKLIVDLNKLRHNTETVVSQCRTMGIQVTGGSSTSYFRVLDGSIPERINMLRIGEAILTPAIMFREFGLPLQKMYTWSMSETAGALQHHPNTDKLRQISDHDEDVKQFV